MRCTSVKNGAEQLVGEVAERLDVGAGHDERVALEERAVVEEGDACARSSSTTGAATSPATIAAEQAVGRAASMPGRRLLGRRVRTLPRRRGVALGTITLRRK